MNGVNRHRAKRRSGESSNRQFAEHLHVVLPDWEPARKRAEGGNWSAAPGYGSILHRSKTHHKLLTIHDNLTLCGAAVATSERLPAAIPPWVRIGGPGPHEGLLAGLFLDAVPGLENPPHRRETDDEEQQRHGEAQRHAHVGGLEEAPAEAADQIDHRVE